MVFEKTHLLAQAARYQKSGLFGRFGQSRTGKKNAGTSSHGRVVTSCDTHLGPGPRVVGPHGRSGERASREIL